MPIRAVTFDCAETLIHVDWRPDRFAVDCALAAGIPLPDDAAEAYSLLYYARINEFLEANRQRDNEAADRFYREICSRWLERIGSDPALMPEVMKEADRLAFGPDSILFKPFEDALPTVQALHDSGIRVAVLSNWDYTLHRVLDIYGFRPHIEFSLASLEEGVEKPSAAFFDIALKRLGCMPDEVMHVGDNPLDDFEGAEGAGMHPCLIERHTEPKLPLRINTLAQVPEAIAWIG